MNDNNNSPANNKSPLQARSTYSITKEIADTLIDFIPIAGPVKLAIEAGIGKKIITGEALDNKQRYHTLIEAAVSTIPIAGPAAKTVRKIQKATKIAKELQESPELETGKENPGVVKKYTDAIREKGAEKPQKQESRTTLTPEQERRLRIEEDRLWNLTPDEFDKKYPQYRRRTQSEITDDLVSEARRQRNKILQKNDRLQLTEQEYLQHFGDGELRQGNVDNCYAVSAINSLKKTPNFELIARSSTEKMPDGSWEVDMPLLNSNGSKVTIKPEEINPQQNPKYSQLEYNGTVDNRETLAPPEGPEGLKVLEAAYIKKRFGEVNRSRAESGSGEIVIDTLLGENFDKLKISSFANGQRGRLSDLPSDQMRKLDEALSNFHPEKDVFVAGTKENPKSTFKVTTKQNDGSEGTANLIPKHSYSIQYVDSEKKIITLSDPHNPSSLINMTLDQFKENFSTLKGGRINHARLLENISRIHGKNYWTPNRTNAAIFARGNKSVTTSKSDRGNVGQGDLEGKFRINARAGQNSTFNDKLADKNSSLLPGKIQAKFIPSPSAPQISSPFSDSQSGDDMTSFITETPGSQDVHDEITQTYTQPSPSFTPARVLNRQFVRRPIGGGGGRIPSLARRSGNKMMGRLGMQAGRMGAQLAAQAAIQTSRLLLNPYVLGAILILLLIIMMVFIVIQMTTGGAVEEKKVSGTGGSCAPVTYKGSDQLLTDSEARTMLSAAGLGPNNIKVGVSLEGIRQNTICGIINFKNESKLNNIVITSGTDGTHSTKGTQSHQNGWKLDIRSTSDNVSNYIISRYLKGANRSDGAVSYKDGLGNVFYYENTIIDKVTGKVRRTEHWDIAFIGNNCQTKIGEVVNPDEEKAPLCEMPAQEVPENTVLSVQGCDEKWATDINSNPLKQNFGDPDCDFDQSTLYDLLTELDPDQADHWFNTVIKKESGYRPNFYSKSLNSNDEKWGLFRMGNGALDPANRGNTNWRQQVANAVAYCRELNSRQISCACYWESWGESCNIKR